MKKTDLEFQLNSFNKNLFKIAKANQNCKPYKKQTNINIKMEGGEIMKNTILAIYTHTGHTYQFENVKNIKEINDKSQFLSFEYVGVRSGLKTYATFYDISGYTIRKV